MKIIVRVLLTILSFFLLGLFCLVLIFGVNKSRDKQTYIFNYTFFYATGESMKPTINEGDFLILRHQDTYQKGDIISYKSIKNGDVTHRVIEVKDGYLTKGDNNNFTDTQTVKNADVYGKVIFRVPNVAFIADFLIQNFVFILMMMTILFILLVFLIKGGFHVRKRSS